MYKTTFIKTVIGELVAHLKRNRKNSPFCHICNVLYHHYVLSRMLL